jgi:hypothetical protein
MRQYPDQHHIVPLAVVNKQLYPCELTRDDRDFLIDNLPGPPRFRSEVKQCYREIWIAAMEREPVDFKKQNAGRYAANCWLRTHWRRGYAIR